LISKAEALKAKKRAINTNFMESPFNFWWWVVIPKIPSAYNPD